MKPLYKFVACSLVALGALGLSTDFLSASEFRYLVPGNIVMTLEPGPETVGPKSLPLIATVRAKIGTPKNVEVYFESTPDMNVYPEKASLSALATEPLKTRVTITKTGTLPKGVDNESWVRMRVVYEPDYESLLRMVENPSRYPDPNERQRLVDRIMKNSEKRARQTDAVRYFPALHAREN